MNNKKGNREIKYENSLRPHLDKLEVKVEKGELYINNVIYEPDIVCPDRLQLLDWNEEKIKELDTFYNDKVKSGGEIHIDSSTFTGYKVEIQSMLDINTAYEALRLKFPGARHVVCAYRLPGKNFVKYQSGCDDGEHGAYRFILNAMKMVEMSHTAIFVTRFYDGKQIGISRFEGYLLAARSAIAHNPIHTKFDTAQQLWSEEYCRFARDEEKADDTNPSHTRQRGRQNRRGGRGRWQGRGARKYNTRGGRGGRSGAWADTNAADNDEPTTK